MLPNDFFDEPQRCRCRGNLVFHECLREVQKLADAVAFTRVGGLGRTQKKPSFLGL
jgi:hypothetical protein